MHFAPSDSIVQQVVLCKFPLKAGQVRGVAKDENDDDADDGRDGEDEYDDCDHGDDCFLCSRFRTEPTSLRSTVRIAPEISSAEQGDRRTNTYEFIQTSYHAL